MREGKIDIIASILGLSSAPVPRSRIASRTKLGPKVLGEYLNLLSSKSLISVTPYEGNRRRGVIVKTTDRGRMFLEMYNSIKMKYLSYVDSSGSP